VLATSPTGEAYARAWSLWYASSVALIATTNNKTHGRAANASTRRLAVSIALVYLSSVAEISDPSLRENTRSQEGTFDNCAKYSLSVQRISLSTTHVNCIAMMNAHMGDIFGS
jgi:hypothetical protein